EHAERIGRGGLLDAQADVPAPFVEEALAHHPGSDPATRASRPRARVDAEEHGDGRLVDPDRRQRLRALAVGDRVPDVDLLDPRDGDDVAGERALDLEALEAPPAVEPGEPAHGLAAVRATER